MKKISIFILVIGLLSFLSCKKDETKATLASPPTPSVLSLTGGAQIVLKKTDSAVMIPYNWTASSFGQTLVTTYTVQMDRAGNNFKDAIAVGTVNNALTVSVLTYDLNMKILPMEFDPANPEPLNMEFRVMTTINQYVTPVYSPTVAQTITPFFVKIVYPILFVPGIYQGWNPADSSTTIASKKSDGKYEGYMWFGVDNNKFKYCQGNSWTNNWGDDGQDGTLNKGGADIAAGAKGYYKLNVDLPNLTHKFLLTTWAAIGDATPGGWNTDSPMAYDTVAKTWSVTLNLTAAKIKFRANAGWDLNYGDDGSNTGTLKEAGLDISVPSAGTYTIIMDLSKPVYKYKLIKN